MAARRERVVLELKDDFSTPMAKAVVATAALQQALDKLDGTGIKVGVHMRDTGKQTKQAGDDIDQVAVVSRKADTSINQLTGRIRLLADVAAILGPSLIPIGAVGIPAVTGLAQQFGFAALAGGTMLVAFQGVGDALEAVNKAALEPTAANIEAARLAMEGLSPAAQDLVTRVREFIPALKGIRDSAAEGMFPGITAGLDGFEQGLPRFERVVSAISQAVGDIAQEAGESLGGERWAEFFDYLATDGPSALADMASAVGNVTHAMAGLWMAFDPLNDDFSGWLVRATADLDKWAAGLSQTEGFQDFVDYIRTNGPIVADAMGAIGTALVDIITAAAPLGGPVLRSLEGVANVISAIAESDLGTPIMAGVAALALYNRTMAVTAGLRARMNAAEAGSGGGMVGGFLNDRRASASGALKGARADVAALAATWATAGARTEREAARMSKATASLRSNLGTLAKEGGRVAGPLAGVALASSGAADSLGAANTATLALYGSAAGPLGSALGATIGLLMDMSSASDTAASSAESLRKALDAGDIDDVRLALKAVGEETGTVQRVLGNIKLNPFAEAKDEFAELDKLREAARSQSIGQGAFDIAEQLTAAQGGMRGVLAAGAMSKRGFDLTAAGAAGAGSTLRDFVRSISRANNALAGQGTVDAYRQSLFDLQDALKQNGPDLSEFSRKGLENRAALRGVASAALEAAKNISSPQQRTNFLDRARDDFIRTAVAAGATRRQARGLADDFGLVDRIRARPKVEEQGSGPAAKRVQTLRDRIAEIRSKMVNMDEKGAAAARVRIARLRAEIAALRDKSINVTTYLNTIRNNGGVVGGRAIAADGATVPKTGRHYADRHLYLLADGEEVISNRHGQADRHRDLLKAINSNRLADGGTTGGAYGTATSGGTIITFPSPTVMREAADAAESIAVNAGLAARSYRDQQRADLGILQQRQRISQLETSLNEKVDQKVGKRGKGKKDKRKTIKVLAMQGIDRDTANAELDEARRELEELIGRRSEVDELRQKLLEDRISTRDELYGTFDPFSRGTSGRSVANSVRRQIAAMASYGQVLARLKSAGASGPLMMQVMQVARRGDFVSATKFGNSVLNEPGLLAELNSGFDVLGAVSSNLSAYMTDPRIATPGAGAIGSSSFSAEIVLAADPSAWMAQVMTQVGHMVDTKLAVMHG